VRLKCFKQLSSFQNLRRKGSICDHCPGRPKDLLHHCVQVSVLSLHAALFTYNVLSCRNNNYLFAPIAVETMVPLNISACQLFAYLGRKISSTSGDEREGAFLFQRVLVLVQCYNAVLLYDTLPAPEFSDDDLYPMLLIL